MNEVQVVVSDRYVSRGGFGIAKKDAKDLNKEIKDLDSSSKGLGKTLGSLPSALSGLGSKAGNALSGGFTKGVDAISDGLQDKLPKALSNPYVAGAAAAAGTFVGAAMAGATVTAFGAGLSALGMKSAANAPGAKNVIEKFKQDMSAGMSEISKPFEKTWIDITSSAKRHFDTLKPQLAASFKDMAPAVSKFGDDLGLSLTKFGPALEPIGRAFKAVLADLGMRMPGVVEGLADSFSDLSKSIEKNPQALGRMVELIGKLGELGVNEMTSLNNLFSDFEEEGQMISNFFDGNGYKTDAELGKNAKQGLDDLKSSADQTTPAMRTVAAAFEEIGDAGDDSAKKASALLRLMDQLSGQTPDYTQALSSSADAIDKIGDVFKDAEDRAKGFGSTLLDQAGAFDVTNENGRELYDQVRDVQEAFTEMASAVSNGQGSREQFISDTNRMRDRLNETWRQAGLNEQQIAALNRQYALTPQQIVTSLQLLGVNTAQGMIDGFIRMNNGRTIQIYTSALGSGGLASAGRLATGGISSTAHAATGGARGGDTIINEHGPENVRLPNGSMVINAGTTRRLEQQMFDGGGMGAGGGPIQIVIELDGKQIALAMIDPLKGVVRKRGGKPEVLG